LLFRPINVHLLFLFGSTAKQNLRCRCLLNHEDLTAYKIAYSAVDGKTQIARK